MGKLLGTMQIFAQQQSRGHTELKTTLNTMGQSPTLLKEAMSPGDSNYSLVQLCKICTSKGENLSDQS